MAGDIGWQPADAELPRITERHTSLYGETRAEHRPNYDNWHAAAAMDAAREVIRRAIKADPYCPADYEPSQRVLASALEVYGGDCVDVVASECPACLAYARNKRLALPVEESKHPVGYCMFGCSICTPQTVTALPVDETFTQAEGLAGKADEVMKGILDGTLSRPKVKQIGDAVTERTKKDGGSDALGGAIGRSNRHGSFMGRRTPYSD